MVTAVNPYLRLNLLRGKLDDAIEDFFVSRDEECTYGKVEQCNGDRYRLRYTVNGSKEILDFRFNKDETTSLDLTSGGKSSFKEELAISLKSSPICTNEEIRGFKKPYFVVKGIRLEDVEASLSLIGDDANVSLAIPCDITGGKRWIISNEEGQRVTVSYFFKSEKSLIQGKPLKLFNEVYTTLMLLLEIEDMPRVMEENLAMETSSDISKEKIEGSLDQYIPDAKPHLNNKLQKMLCQSIFNLRVDMDMFEYGFLTFPALKALEGHLKYVMKENSIPLIEKRFSMFTKEGSSKYILHGDYQAGLDAKKINAINDAYTFYNKNRNSIFHWAEVDTAIPLDRTRLIDNIAEARSIILNVFEIVNNYYK
ncbi:RNase LS family HEPN domain-containing protein [Bacillus cereus group sp. MYBK71-2]|uniref:RNase LS family HEPN domain-containing protein n=1 Tax=Bacillus cereus group sp. MYBK71-2 TaxID=3450611 RepID=UPI003F7A0702